MNRLATRVVWCSIAVASASSGYSYAERFELRQSRVHQAPPVVTKNFPMANMAQGTHPVGGQR